MEKTILVIDDSEVALEIITDDLTEAGFSVLSAASSTEAYNIIQTGYKPDLILVDVMMPGMNGDEFCRLVKSRPQSRDIPIVFVSTKEESELAEMIQRTGANGFIGKASFTSGRVAQLLQNFIK